MEELDFINRSAILVMPRKPFFDWLNYLDPDMPMSAADINEYNTYLVKGDFADLDEVLEENYERIFERELLSMWTVEEDWPQTRTFDIFRQWFDCKMSAVVFDLAEGSIVNK
ncbi:MAG: hypothetical protein Roseis2KO_52610 [Roseivirga sp.]